MITIILDKTEFYPGETIKGNIELVPDSEIYITDIELCFIYLEEWNYTKSEQDKDKSNYKQSITLQNLGVNKFLPEGENNLIQLSPILHLFPFEIKLPEFLFPSFEYPKHDYTAFFRYSLIARLKSPNMDLELATSNYIFILSKSPKENNNYEIESSFSIKKWGIFGKGTTHIKASIPLTCYKFADNIPINVEVDNSNGKMKVTLVKINLVRNMILRSNQNDFKTKYSFIDKVMKKIFKVEVRSGTKDIFKFQFPLSQMPHNEFSFFDNVNLYNWTKSYCEFMPSTNSNIISCQYLLKITLYFDSFIKKADRPRIRIPINISHKLENNNNNLSDNLMRVTTCGDEVNEIEIRKQKDDDFVFLNNNNNINNINNYQNDKNVTPNDKPLSSNSFNKTKTVSNNNYSYIENLAHNNKNINNNEKITPKPNNINNKEENKIKENNNNYRIRANTYIDDNNVINDNQIINNQDQGEAPTWQNLNENSGNNINNNNN